VNVGVAAAISFGVVPFALVRRISSLALLGLGLWSSVAAIEHDA
jgi:hypothetical protein